MLSVPEKRRLARATCTDQQKAPRRPQPVLGKHFGGVQGLLDAFPYLLESALEPTHCSPAILLTFLRVLFRLNIHIFFSACFFLKFLSRRTIYDPHPCVPPHLIQKT